MASPELEMIIAQLRTRNPLRASTPQERRAELETLTSVLPVPDDVRVEPTRAGAIAAEWIRPPGVPGTSNGGVMLYLHGGGYMIGSLATHRCLIAGIAAAGGVSALAIDYRLAPESPFPAAVEDATAAYRWLLDQGVSPARVVIAGDSAGGGLTIATLVSARDAKLPMPAAAVCLSPWVDLEALGASMTERAVEDPILQKDDILGYAAAYLGRSDPRSPLAAPLYADLSGLPPLLIQVGEAEVLYDDAVRIAERARDAGVSVTLDSWPEMIHVWQAFAPMLLEGRQAIEGIGQFVRTHVG